MPGPLSLLRASRSVLTAARQARHISRGSILKKAANNTAFGTNMSFSENSLAKRLEGVMLQTEKNTDHIKDNARKIEFLNQDLMKTKENFSETKMSLLNDMAALKVGKTGWMEVLSVGGILLAAGTLIGGAFWWLLESNMKYRHAVTKDSIDKLESKVEGLTKDVATMNTTVTEIKTTVNLLSRQLLGSQPNNTTSTTEAAPAPPPKLHVS